MKVMIEIPRLDQNNIHLPRVASWKSPAVHEQAQDARETASIEAMATRSPRFF